MVVFAELMWFLKVLELSSLAQNRKLRLIVMSDSSKRN